MEIISVIDNKDYLNDIVKSKGYAPSHNLNSIIDYRDKNEVAYFVRIAVDEGIFVYHDTKTGEWTVISDVIAPKERRIEYLMSLLGFLFGKGAKKIWIESDEESRKELMNLLKDAEWRSSTVRYSLMTPVYNMKIWDGDKMQGKDWKDIRYYWNKFFKDHKVEIKDAKDFSPETLKDILIQWKKERRNWDRANISYVMNVIDSNFLGFDIARIIVVDGKPSSITAGYTIPNSNNYYSAMGIQVREFDRLGEIANMDDLINIKRNGFDYADFGNGLKELTDFKRKFKPEYIYKTYIFSVVRK